MSAQEAYEIALHRIEEAAQHRSKKLSLSDLTDLETIPPEIGGLVALITLSLQNTQVSDLDPLNDLAALKELNLEGTQIADLTPLKELIALQRIDLAGTQVVDLYPLGNLTKLQKIYLNSTKVADVTALESLSLLQSHDLDGTQVKTLDSLRDLSALQKLHLNRTEISDIAPIRGLSALRRLSLSVTKVAEISPLKGLSALQSLYLSRTLVADLRPLLSIPSLRQAAQKNEGSYGVYFRKTPATQVDPTLAAIAAIGDRRKRTESLFDYLETLPPWPLPLEEHEAYQPQQKSSLDFIWTANGFALNSRPVSVDDDPVAVATRDELVELMNELCRQSGNHHDDIFRRGDTLRMRLEEPELDLLRIHLAFQRLQRVYDQRGNREDPLQPEVAATLQDVVEILPGLTLGDERVRDLLERQARNRTDRVDAAQIEAEIGVLQALTADDAPFDEEAQDLAKDASAPEIDDQLTRSRPTLAWNAIVAVGQEFKNAPLNTTTIAVGLPAAVYASAPRLVAHADEILLAARLWGAEFLGWINPIISQARAITEAMNQRKG